MPALDSTPDPLSDQPPVSEDTVNEQAIAGLDGLTQQYKSEQHQTKQGKPTGITSDFPKPWIIDREELACAAEAIHEACAGIGTSDKTIKAVLKDKSTTERAVINEIYVERYHLSLLQQFYLKMDGAELAEALSLLSRRTGADDAGRIHTALIERGQLIEGRSDRNCEKDIRDTVATMNSAQISALDQEYGQRFQSSMSKALLEDENLPDATREVLRIYLKGTDRRTTADTVRIAELALQERSIDMFQEAMRDASADARQAFMAKHGKEELKKTFGGIVSDVDFNRAMDYATAGHLSTAEKIRENTHWHGDNEKAIEQALAQMSSDERIDFQIGLQLARGEVIYGLSDEELAKARSVYTSIHEAVVAAGNNNEVAQWEDQAMHKNGSLVTRLAKHRGSIYDDGMQDVLADIETMDKKDWLRLKHNLDYRREVEEALQTYLSTSEFRRAADLLDAKLKADSFQEAAASGRRSVLAAIKDNSGFFDDNEENIYDALRNMSPAEKIRYLQDNQFRQQVDKAVKDVLDSGAEQDVAFSILKKNNRAAADAIARAPKDPSNGGIELTEAIAVLTNSKPTELDIIDKLNAQAGKASTEKAQVVRDLQKAFRADPTLCQRLNSCISPEDDEFAKRFNIALRRALDPDAYSKYARPLLATGHLPIHVLMDLNKGDLNDDEQAAYKDLIALAADQSPAAVDEQHKLLYDKEYQTRVLGFLSHDERQVAMFALSQGKMRPEDVLRSYMIGAGTGEEEIKAELRKLSPEQIVEMRRAYAKKYHEDLDARLVDELGGQDLIDAQRLTRRPASSDRETFNNARDEFYRSRDGIGRLWVDNCWDGTGYMSDDTLNNYAAAVSRTSAALQELTPAQRKELTENLQRSLDAFRESKGAAGDMVVDAVIMAAALAGAKFTGGASLTLIAYTTIGGAAFKVGTKAAIMGSDYDWASSQVLIDALTGGIDTATLFVGPAQLGQAMKLGERAAVAASEKIIQRAGQHMLREGAEQLLAGELKKLVATAIAHGAEGIDDKVIVALSRKLAAEGQVAALAPAIKKSLEESLEQEARSALKRHLTELAFNAGAGATGGGTSGAVRGLAEWDDTRSVQENVTRLGESVAMGAGSGAVMATGLTVAGKALGAGYDGIKAKLEKKPGATDHVREPQAHLDSKHDEPGNRPGDSHTGFPADSCRQVPLQDPYTEKPNLRKVPDSVRPSEKALEQSNHFARNHEISEKLRDGYHEGPGTYAEFGTDGRFLCPSVEAPAVVVDRANDPVLRDAIAEAHRRFDHLPPREKAEGLSRYARELLKPADMSELDLNNWQNQFDRRHKGERIYLGEYIKEGKGVCRHQALLLKVLGDEFDLPTTLITGAGSGRYPNSLNHAWVEIEFGPRDVLVFDPRWGDHGVAHAQSPERVPGRVVEARRLGMQELPSNKEITRRSEDGKVASTRDVYGRVTAYEYGDDKRLAKVTLPNGQTYERVGPREWLIRDPARPGKEMHWQGDMGVITNDGSRWIAHEDGRFESRKLDGKQEIRNPNYSRQVLDGNSQVLETKDAKGVTRGFEYDEAGNLQRVTCNGKVEAERDSAGTWVKRDEKGRPYWQGRVTVDTLSGSLLEIDSQTGISTEFQLSGNRKITARSGEYRLLNNRNLVLESKDVDGVVREFTYGKDDQLTQVMTSGGPFFYRETDGKWHIQDKFGNRTIGGEITADYFDGSMTLPPSAKTDAGEPVQHPVQEPSRGDQAADGRRMAARPSDQAENPELMTVPDSSYPSKEALDQSNKFARDLEIGEPLVDGYQQGTWIDTEFGSDGQFIADGRPINGQAIVVDRGNDPVLAAVIKEAHAKFDGLTPTEQAEALSKYAREQLSRHNMADGELDRWQKQFEWLHQGKRIYLGEFINQGRGTCLHQALLLKVLGDEFGLSVTLVYGAGRGQFNERINHSWTHIDFGDGRMLVFDPRWGENGIAYADTPDHVPSSRLRPREVEGQELPAGAEIELTPDGKVKSTKNIYGDVDRYEYGVHGEVSKVALADGRTFEKIAGSIWELTEPGSPAAEWHGTMSVNAENGCLTIINDDGIFTSIKLNGMSERRFALGGKVVSIRDGQLVYTEDVFDVGRTFDYSKDGHLDWVTTTDGTVYERTESGTWVKYDERGLPQWEGQVSVDQATGTLQESSKGSQTEYLLDGTRRITDRSGSSRLLSYKDQLLESTDANGVVRTFSYSYPEGQLIGIKGTDGSVYEWQDGNRWSIKDKSGSRTIEGTVEVDYRDGTILLRPDLEGTVTTINLDGTVKVADESAT